MPRVKHTPTTVKRKKRLLKKAKGFYLGRRSLYKTAAETLRRAMSYAYRDRLVRKRDFRRLWITRISAACKERGIAYNRFIAGLKNANILLNRKMLAELAVNDADAFGKIVDVVKTYIKNV